MAALAGLVRRARTLALQDPDRPGARAEPSDQARWRDLRVVPLALAAWAAAWWATGGGVGGTRGAADSRLGLVVLLAVTALAAALVLSPALRAAVLRRRAWLLATTLVVLAVGAVGTLRLDALRSGPVAELAGQQAAVTARVMVTGDPTLHAAAAGRPPLVTTQVRLLEVDGRGGRWRIRAPVLVLAGGDLAAAWQVLPVGATVATTGRLLPPDPGDDVAGVLRVSATPEVVVPPGRGARSVERVRAGLREAVAHRDPEPRALVPALVLGDTSAISPELRAAFEATGLTHLTAVSGANLTLLLAFLLLAARWSGVRGWALRGVGLAGVVVFVALCRTEPSVLRAAAMGLVALAALGSGGRAAGVRNLGVAMVLLLLLDPFLSRSWGFALSVLASGGIIWWARSWADVLSRWLPRLVAESVTLPLAAHLTTLPVIAALSGTVSLAGLAANAIAGPFVGPATVLGFAAAGASLVSGHLAAVLGFGAAWSAAAIIAVARTGAGLPGADVTWPAGAGALAVLAAGSLLVALCMRWVLARRWLCAALVVAMVVALIRVPTPPGWPPPGWRFVACDVGQGDGLALWAGPGEAVVVDSGPDPALIRRCLDGLGVKRVPLLVLSHFHADHADGLTGVFAGRTVGRLWVSPLAEPVDEVAAVHALAAEHGLSVEVPGPGTGVAVGVTTLDVVGPLPPRGVDGDASAAQNDASLVLRADVDGLSVLLTGDVEPPGQRALLAAGTDLRASVLKVPHHGSARQEPDFFAATGATVAVASAGQDNDYGHPAPRMLALAQSLRMTVLRTDEHGAVALAGRDGSLQAVTARPP